MIEWCLQEHSVGAFCRSMRRRFHKGDARCSGGRLFFVVHYSFARRSFTTFLYLRPMTTHATPTTTAIIPATGTASNRINPKSARTAPRTIMRIPQTLYVFAEYSFFCGAFVELDAAGFPFDHGHYFCDWG